MLAATGAFSALETAANAVEALRALKAEREPLERRLRVRSAIRNALRLESAPTRSYTPVRSRMMLMKKAAPAEFAVIMGSAITFTSATASAWGRATSRMMIICTASATAVVARASQGLTSRSCVPLRAR
jgi:hypothetical protein